MLRLLKSKNVFVIVLYPVFGFLLMYMRNRMNVYEDINDKSFVFYGVLRLLSGVKSYKIFYFIISALFIAITGFLYNKLVQGIKISEPFQNMHGLLFVLFTGATIKHIEPLRVFVSLLFFIMFLRYTLNLADTEKKVFSFFYAGIFLSLSSFFVPGVIFFYPVIITGMMFLGSLSFRNVVASLTGAAVPYFMLFSVYFFIFSNFDLFFDFYESFSANDSILKPDAGFLITSGLFFLILLISGFYVFLRFRTSESFKQTYYVFFVVFSILFLIYFVSVFNFDFNFIPFFIISATVPAGAFFSDKSFYLFKEIILDLFIISLFLSGTNLLSDIFHI